VDPYLRRVPGSPLCQVIVPPSPLARNLHNWRTPACGCDFHRAESARETDSY